MDVSRELLNNLMGRDRNKPKGYNDSRDHYGNRDVCKPYLVSFCFSVEKLKGCSVTTLMQATSRKRLTNTELDPTIRRAEI